MNRQNTVDPVTELFERVNINIKKKEFFLLLIVGIIGCAGTMAIFNRAAPPSTPATNQLSTINIPKVAKSKSFFGKLDPFLSIQGDFRAEKSIEFAISNYNPKAHYEVNFGDGDVIRSNAQVINHVYKKDGEYNVELIIHYKNESNSIFNTKVNISPPSDTFLSSL
ncbi:PKD domain-containing protein [Portibacter lacus]|uniref:PKD domain-containing protein n=1 Tax=Portibacter lacus TaxID=1099794 RepID=A0AA37SNZ0_9BACT|nr:PKD domain-containing protein [Portibacter lacus]GLR17230.1 hypothetical protein GCM10007940_18450 [Portibacter lacus]